MNKPPLLAIVGRPNVGKSALFNCLCGQRIAIVDEAEGITRDRIYGRGELFGREYEVVDTGGIDPRSTAPFNEQVRRQALIAVEEAQSLIMVVDATVGPTSLDKEVADLLLRSGKPLVVAVNKVDSPSQEWLTWTFAELGVKQMVPVSATQRWQIAELLEAALPPALEERVAAAPAASALTKVAIIGRPNVGKSSLVNTLLDEERCIVSPLPGTTRDSIDLPLRFGERDYLFIDTAGIRRKKAEKEVVDKFAALRTEKAIERCDLCLLMVDSVEGLTTQEKRLATTIEEAGKGCIVLFNKWDLVKGFRMEHCLREIEETVPFLRHCPKLFISALSGRNVAKIFEAIDEVYAAQHLRITTHQLNKFLQGAMQLTHPPMIGGKRLRIYYMSQVETAPPTFIFFVNNPDLLTATYKKYLLNQFRKQYPFTGVPLRVFLRGKQPYVRGEGE